MVHNALLWTSWRPTNFALVHTQHRVRRWICRNPRIPQSCWPNQLSTSHLGCEDCPSRSAQACSVWPTHQVVVCRFASQIFGGWQNPAPTEDSWHPTQADPYHRDRHPLVILCVLLASAPRIPWWHVYWPRFGPLLALHTSNPLHQWRWWRASSREPSWTRSWWVARIHPQTWRSNPTRRPKRTFHQLRWHKPSLGRSSQYQEDHTTRYPSRVYVHPQISGGIGWAVWQPLVGMPWLEPTYLDYCATFYPAISVHLTFGFSVTIASESYPFNLVPSSSLSAAPCFPSLGLLICMPYPFCWGSCITSPRLYFSR